MKTSAAVNALRRREIVTEHTHEVKTDLAEGDRERISVLEQENAKQLQALGLMAQQMRKMMSLTERLSVETKQQLEITDQNMKRRA